MSELEILCCIQRATLERHKSTMVICINTNTIFSTVKEAEKWCGSSIVGNLYRPDLNSYSGRHPKTNEKLKWLKYCNYLESTTPSGVSA